MAPNEVDVFVELGEETVLAGRLWMHQSRQAESASFRYSSDYLTRRDAYEIDPQLKLEEGQFQTAVGRAMFGAFTDCAPDRWGRRLINRDERNRAEGEGGRARSFAEKDYLLGVRDDLRQGALRFLDRTTDEFLAASDEGIPLLIGLGPLLTKADHLERDEATADEVRDLVRAGSSLGGARPKAHVVLPSGEIAIAKFPSPTNDEWDVMRWEGVALELARRSGVNTPGWQVHEIDAKAVLIVTRFDRSGAQRIGYASALTMLELTDGDDASYLDIVETIEAASSEPTADLRELWRRIALSLLISNTDDHLRNHGFLRLSTAGWRLSPIFDINPNPRPVASPLATTIEFGRPETLETLIDLAGFFRLSNEEAEGALREVAEATSAWRTVAAASGLSRQSVEAMAPAFEHAQASLARELTGV